LLQIEGSFAMIHPLTLLKGAGLGAGMMYFFDPVAGNRRRALVRDQFVHACKVCNQQAGVTYRDASNRLHGVSAEMRSVMQSSDQPLMERVQEGAVEVGHTLGMQRRTWPPTAKAAAMLCGAGLVASFMDKRDLAALAFGAVGLSFLAKEVVDRENMRTAAGQRAVSEPQKANKRSTSAKALETGSQSRETNDGASTEASVRTEKQAIHNL
jgi:hypothetical protein